VSVAKDRERRGTDIVTSCPQHMQCMNDKINAGLCKAHTDYNN